MGELSNRPILDPIHSKPWTVEKSTFKISASRWRLMKMSIEHNLGLYWLVVKKSYIFAKAPNE